MAVADRWFLALLAALVVAALDISTVVLCYYPTPAEASFATFREETNAYRLQSQQQQRALEKEVRDAIRELHTLLVQELAHRQSVEVGH